ncbi:MAG: hypothetical protein QXO51_00905 [Halobacteria archaeon]
MGEFSPGRAFDPAAEERIRALIRDVLEQELVEWRVAIRQLVRAQEEISTALGKFQRQLPAAATLFHSPASGGLPNGIEAERRKLERFLHSMERSYQEGKITEIELARGRQRIGERLDLLRRVEKESAEP